MRAPAVLLALLLLLAPLAAASDGGKSGPSTSESSTSTSTSTSSTSDRSGSDPALQPSSDNGTGNGTASSNSTAPPPPPRRQGDGCPSPERPPGNESEVQACQDRHCRQHPEDERCQPDGSGKAPKGWDRWCRDEARDDAQRTRCRDAIDSFRAGGADHWVTFTLDSANATLLDYSVAGTPVFESLHLETGSDNLTVDHTGDSLLLGDVDTQLALHDDPTGLVRLKGDDGSVTIRFPASTTVARAEDDSVARIGFTGGRIGYLRADNATWVDGRTVVLAGFFAFLLPPPDKQDHDPQAQVEVKQAIEDRKIGAEITVDAPEAGATAASGGNGTVKVLAYDDVDVHVKVPLRLATPESPIRVELSADLPAGRTIVLNLNRSVLQNGDPGSLVLRYYDLHEQADGSTVESEVVFHEASSLQDVLDPTNDQGQPEYWVVQDAHGLQAMVSVPHWSAHAITVASLAQVLEQPNVLYGIVAGGVGTMLAAVAMLWPRRPDEP